MRQPYQVIVIPYHKNLYAVLQRKSGHWQWVSGGGEDNETPLETAQREVKEEIGIEKDIVELKSLAYIPSQNIGHWKDKNILIPEYSFAVETDSFNLSISDEHIRYEWLTYEQALERLEWGSNKEALRELNLA